MLPDFPTLTAELTDRLFHESRMRSRNGLRSLIPEFRQYEGDRFASRRNDGVIVEGRFDQISTADASIDADAIRLRSAAATIDAIDHINEQLEKSFSDRTFGIIEEAAESVGNVVNASGLPLSPKHLLDAFEQIDMDFASDGTLRLPTIVVHPDKESSLRSALAMLDANPKYSKRRNDILKLKREAWRVREANRTLVD